MLLDPEAAPPRLPLGADALKRNGHRLGVLMSLQDVIPLLAPTLRGGPWVRRLMELVASALARAGAVAQSMERQEQMQISRCGMDRLCLVGFL